MIDLSHVHTLQRQRIPPLLGDPVTVAIVRERPIGSFLIWYHLLTGGQVIPLLLPKTLVDRHYMALRGEDVLVLGFVQGVVIVKQQVKVFAGLAEEEALHAILFGLVHHVVESGIPTPDFGIFF